MRLIRKADDPPVKLNVQRLSLAAPFFIWGEEMRGNYVWALTLVRKVSVLGTWQSQLREDMSAWCMVIWYVSWRNEFSK